VGEDRIQSPDVVARSVVVLMVDKERHGELLYSQEGKFLEMEKGEKGFHTFMEKTVQVIMVERTQEAEWGQTGSTEEAAQGASITAG